jgi:prepilin signal peptidase PulO-like enzyme (type II secretory pathway)
MTAALGAWLGWQLLPFALSLACISGLVMVLVQRQLWRSTTQEGQPQDLSRAAFLNHEIPFGPALAVGFILAWVQIG